MYDFCSCVGILCLMEIPSLRMSVGLGMTREEWKKLRAQVDESFWVMRIIGM